LKNVLIADKDPFTRNILADLFKSRIGLLNVLTAASVKAFLSAAATQQIQVVVIGFHMPETICRRLMTHLCGRHPAIPVFILSKKPSREMRARLKQVHPDVEIIRAQNVRLLIKRILSVLHVNSGGRLNGIGLPSFLQMIELEGCTCTLRISAAGGSGYMGIHNGTPASAACGELRGLAAALRMLDWPDVSIDIDYTPPNRSREIKTSLMGLLLESGRLSDEKTAGPTEHREHRRFDCLVAVNYTLGDDTTDQCDLRDISLGGACLRIRRPVSIGQKIFLTLPVPDNGAGCTLGGWIMRHMARQIGVCFESVSLQQEKAIQYLAASNCALEEELDLSLTEFPD